MGSFCRYRATDYVKQKKLYNQTIKLPRELCCLVPLFLLWGQYLQKDPDYVESFPLYSAYNVEMQNAEWLWL